MTKTLLIIIGLLAAVIAAAGIMWYNDPVNTARRQLYDGKSSVRYKAIYKLSALGDRASIPDIVRLLKDNDPGVRRWAIGALEELNAKESIPEITKLLEDNDLEVRYMTIRAFVKLDAKESIPRIKELLKDKDEWVRNSAEWALKQLGVPAKEIEEAKPDLIDFTGKVTSVSMHDRGPHSLADWLIRIDVTEVNKSDPKIQPGKEFAYWVHSPVQFFHEPGEDAIGKTYKFSVMRSRNEKGEKYPGLKVMDEIIKQRPLLHDKDVSVRRKALSWLVAEADWESIPEIKKLLNDENEQVRKDAAEALEFFDRLEKHIQKNKEQK